MAKAILRSRDQDGTRTMRMLEFGPNETPRSMQLYGTDPKSVYEAVRFLVSEDKIDHLDMNFGCPAPKVTKNGGGSAIPLKPKLLAAIVGAAVSATQGSQVPVTIKFRKGLDDDLLTYISSGQIAQDLGVKAVTLHARTAYQLYSGEADWNAIGELKQAVTSIPVLGNGDIWDGHDAVEMMRQTGCDGVVIGRGCLGKPWLFADLESVLNGGEPLESPNIGQVGQVMIKHATALSSYYDAGRMEKFLGRGIRDFRKHTSWYLAGFPVGSEIRRQLSLMESVEHMTDLLGTLDPNIELPPENRRVKRGHTSGPRPVHLPHGYLDTLDDDVPPLEDYDGGGG